MALKKPPCAFLAADGTELLLDGVQEYGVQNAVTVTAHTVESGSNISDHARSDPKRFTAVVRVSASPLGAVSGPDGNQRLNAAVAWLDAHARQLITIVSQRFGTMTSMVLTKWPTKATVMDHLDFQIEAVQVVIAVAGLVDIPPEAPSTDEAAVTLPDEVDVGEQATTTTDASTDTTATTAATATTSADEVAQEEADTSVMLDILTSMGIEP